MAINNNIYYNAAYTGFLAGVLTGTAQQSTTAGDYATLVTAALAFAAQVDSGIAFDALVTTGASNTQLAITTNTIAANEQWRGGLLRSICESQMSGRYTKDATQADYTQVAAVCVAIFTQAKASLVTP